MSEPKSPARSSPSQVLAREIAERLAAEGLVAAEKRDAVERGLATGALTAEDWRLLVELAVDKDKRR